jgi:hypothetical protein
MKIKLTAILLLIPLTVIVCRQVSAAAYHVTLLNQAPAEATGQGILGDVTVGSAGLNSYYAALWPTPGTSYVNLHPVGYSSSRAIDILGDVQVGWGKPSGYPEHAMLWKGTAESAIELHPSGYSTSIAYAISGTVQAGAGMPRPVGPYHALLWRGTAESFVDLHSADYYETHSVAAAGDGQVGWGSVSQNSAQDHALLWHGTAESAVNLHPPGFYRTMGLGGGDVVQVGYGNTEGEASAAHALLWRGTAASVVDLHPTGFKHSNALAAAGEWQVGKGWLTDGSNERALAWRGTADSVIDLHEILEMQTGLDFIFSRATDVDAFGNIVGWGDTADFVRHAIRWSAVPEPSSISIALVASAMLYRRNSYLRQSATVADR